MAALFISLAVCSVIAFFLIVSRTGLKNLHLWYSYPENIALIVSDVLISVLFFFVVQYRSRIKEMTEYFETMSVKDALTNVYNRRYIDENLNTLVKAITRSGGELTIMVIHVDFFKAYNDSYGHNKGDNCLKILARVLGQTLKRENDFVARYAGTEFLAVLPNTGTTGAGIMAERLLKNVRDCNIPHEKNEAAKFVTVSIGAAAGKADYTQTGEDYIKKAQDALAVSKQNGYNRFTLLGIN